MNQNVLAIDIGGSKMLCSIVDGEGNPGTVFRQEMPAQIDVASLTDAILTIARKTKNSRRREVSAIGVTIPGVADADAGVWVYAPFSGIRDYPIAAILKEEFGLPVTIDNDVNACALGEKVYGCCQDTDDFAWITISNGVGGAIFCGGHLIRGVSNGAGEFGHIVVEPGGNTCPCSHVGCLEAQASGRAIALNYEAVTGQRLSALDIAVLAKQGDATALAVYRQTGRWVGRALAQVVNIINPRKLVFGGGVSMDLELLEPGILESLGQMAFESNMEPLVLCKTALSYNAALIGAATLAQTKGGKTIA